jgi:ubiquinone/menaquinone biosynthesis C-methylase UbiE
MDKKNESITWDETWKETKELPLFRKISYDFIKTRLNKVLKQVKLAKNAKIIDVACGSGTTLNFFRELNYLNSIGIDKSPNSLKLCKKLFGFKEDKDVFRMNALRTNFTNKEFDLVFSNGLLEHSKDFSSFVKEICRISKQYVLLFQPDPTSLIGRIVRWLILKKIVFHGEIEYFYDKTSYENSFSKFNFNLISSGKYGLGGIYFLFERKE